MLRKPLIVAAAIGAALLLAGCDQPATLLEQQGGPTEGATAWTFTAPGAWDLHWSYSDCPDGLVWIDDLGATADPIGGHHQGDAVAVFAVIPPLLQYRTGLRAAEGVKHFDQGGPVRLRVNSRCRWQLRAVAV